MKGGENMKETRQYGLFEKQGGKWIRLYPSISALKSRAIRIFQDKLLEGCFTGKRRALKSVKFPY